MKMYEAGLTRKEMYGDDMPEIVEGSSKKGQEKKIYPHLDLNSNQFPDISKLKVGQKCMLMIEVKPTRYSINEKEGDKNPKSSMCFEVMRVGMADDQDAGEEGDKKVDKMVEKMYSKDDKK